MYTQHHKCTHHRCNLYNIYNICITIVPHIQNHIVSTKKPSFQVLGLGLSQILSWEVIKDQQARGMSFIKYHFNKFHYYSAKFPLCFQKLCFWKTKFIFSFFVKILKFSNLQPWSPLPKHLGSYPCKHFSEETIISTNFSKKRNQKSKPIKFKKCQNSKH